VLREPKKWMTTVREDNGFTLIELLLVILIIAILATIAIPVFLAQRERAWNSQVQSALKNAATAQESYSTDNEGNYATTVAELEDEGLRFGATEVDFVDSDITAVGSIGYCMEARSAHKSAIAWYHDSNLGVPKQGGCSP
jgi:prepilin-type N-terminal cleavage/methylation domain-containing protein